MIATTQLETSAAIWRARALPGWDGGRREKTLNWLAFGLLLAAWNFCDNDAAVTVRAARDPAMGALVIKASRYCQTEFIKCKRPYACSRNPKANPHP
jgi:hypothetical protein